MIKIILVFVGLSALVGGLLSIILNTTFPEKMTIVKSLLAGLGISCISFLILYVIVMLF